MRNLIAIFFLFSGQILFSQINSVGAQQAGMANVSAPVKGSQSLFGNQAGLAFLGKFTAAASVERRFLLSEMNLVIAGAALRTRSGVFGVVLQSFGYQEFRQQKAGLSYARMLIENFSVGAQFDYFQTRIPEYGSAGFVTFEIGIQAILGKQLTVGAHVFSPAKVSWGGGETVPTVFKMGVAYQPSKTATVALELEKDVDYKLRPKLGLEYRPSEMLALRGGVGSNPVTVSIGVGYRLSGGIQFDAASQWHQVIGVTPAAAIVFSKK